MKIKRKTLRIILIGVLVIVLAIIGLVAYKANNKAYGFSGDSFYYSSDRGKPEYALSLKYENESYTTYEINFLSRDFLSEKTRMYGLLFVPRGKESFPGIVLVPGGGVTKEQEAETASKFCLLGYAVLTIDQRGIGETGGSYFGIEEDYGVFSSGKEPMQHLAVYDVLLAFDVLGEIKGVDKDNIAVVGESMGGRYGLIATTLDKRIKGFIGISTAGFHVKKDKTVQYNSYLLSIDPDNYIERISPRQLVMLQSRNDTIVRMEDAKITFDRANEPKKFYTEDCPGHGYCDKMAGSLKEALEKIFK